MADRSIILFNTTRRLTQSKISQYTSGIYLCCDFCTACCDCGSVDMYDMNEMPIGYMQELTCRPQQGYVRNVVPDWCSLREVFALTAPLPLRSRQLVHLHLHPYLQPPCLQPPCLHLVGCDFFCHF